MIPNLLPPIGLGLLGFLEPCSLGANAIFLSYVLPLPGWRRVGEALAFTLSRGVFLGLLGTSHRQERAVGESHRAYPARPLNVVSDTITG